MYATMYTGKIARWSQGSHSVIKYQRNDTFEFCFLELLSRLLCKVYLYSSANMSASAAKH